jgi:hypothetical protein
MLEDARKFFQSRGGAIAAAVLGLVAMIALVAAIRSTFGADDATELITNRIYICSETHKGFKHKVERGETVPILSPYTGKNTGYPAELCYWTKDGKIKNDPTPVLLNMTIGKPGATFCPDCGRLVVPYNPRPLPDSKPPPTEEEYKKQRSAPRE